MGQRQTHKRTKTLSKIRWCTTGNIHFSFPPKSMSSLVSCISGKFLLALSLQSALSLSHAMMVQFIEILWCWFLVLWWICIALPRKEQLSSSKMCEAVPVQSDLLINKEQCSYIKPVRANILHITSCCLNCFTQ